MSVSTRFVTFLRTPSKCSPRPRCCCSVCACIFCVGQSSNDAVESLLLLKTKPDEEEKAPAPTVKKRTAATGSKGSKRREWAVYLWCSCSLSGVRVKRLCVYVSVGGVFSGGVGEGMRGSNIRGD